MFQAKNTRARKWITDSILKFLANQLAEFGVSIWFRLDVPKGPTLMDVAASSSLSLNQLQQLNRERIHYKYMYWEEDSELKWPQRKIKREDRILFKIFIREHLCSTHLIKRFSVPKSNNKIIKPGSTRLYEVDLSGRLTYACDRSLFLSNMGTSFSFFQEEEELYFDTRPVHGSPRSSTRAEMFKGVLCLSVTSRLEKEKNKSISLSVFCDNQRTIEIISRTEVPSKKNDDFEEEILYLLTEIKGEVNAIYVKTHQDDHTDIQNLPQELQAQIRCDVRSGALTRYSSSPSLELLPAPLSHQSVIFTNAQGILPLRSYSYINTSLFLNAAEENLGLTTEILWKVDWGLFGQALKRVSKRDYNIVKKIMWSATPSQMRLNKY